MIKEVIVVEGKDDVSAVKAAVDAEVITTNGFGYGKELIDLLKKLAKRRGLIIFTDPDFVGDRIRKDISGQIKGCKHAFLTQSKAARDIDIGIENAKPEDIKEAIRKAKPEISETKDEFTKSDMLYFHLEGRQDSKGLRDRLGDELGIGYGNAKQFLSRLNSFNISKQEFIDAIERIQEDDR